MLKSRSSFGAMIVSLSILSISPVFAAGNSVSTQVLSVIDCTGSSIAETSGAAVSEGVRLQVRGVEQGGKMLVLKGSNGVVHADVDQGTANFGPFTAGGTWELCPVGGITFSELEFVPASGKVASNTTPVIVAGLAGIGSVVAIGSSRSGDSSTSVAAGSGTSIGSGTGGTAAASTGGSSENNHSNGNSSGPRRCAAVDCGLDEEPAPLSPIS